eukprot:scaffold1384_cov116-Cylindrotheca_fusiformis.AAC.40
MQVQLSNAIVFVLGVLVSQGHSFTISRLPSRSKIAEPTTTHRTCSFRLSSNCDDDAGEHDKIASGIPQLPAIGSSSFHRRIPTVSAEMDNAGAAFVSPKFELQYTCKVCNTRNCNLVSRIAYREGVVIAVCKGCNAKHMIADNLGSGCLDGDKNIEDYFKAKGMEDIVNRVTQEVFELEKMLDLTNLVGEDGNPILE